MTRFTINIITEPNQADSYQYVIIGKSKSGRHINAGFSHKNWDTAIHHYLSIANQCLASLGFDSLDSVLLVSNDQLSSNAYIDALLSGLNPNEIQNHSSGNPLANNPDHTTWLASNGYDSYRDVTHIEQLTANLYSYDMIMKYDGKIWGDYLITVTTKLNQHFAYACNGFASGTLTNIWERTTHQCDNSHNDPIRTIILSKKDNSHHMAIIKHLLNNLPNLELAHLQRLISIRSEGVANHQDKPLNNQSGRTGVYSVLAILIIILLSLSSCYGLAYTTNLSKNVSGQASRNLLAFFVPVIDTDSQSLSKYTGTAPEAHISATREHSLISMANHLPTSYDGLTLQNIIAERRICRAVTNVTESKTRHPIPSSYSVASTQKTLGDSYHG